MGVRISSHNYKVGGGGGGDILSKGETPPSPPMIPDTALNIVLVNAYSYTKIHRYVHTYIHRSIPVSITSIIQ